MAQHLQKLVYHHYLHLVAAAISAADDTGVNFSLAVSKLGVASITTVAKPIRVYTKFAYFGQVNSRF